VAGYTRWDLSLDYSGWRQVKLFAQVYNVFNTRAPIAVASWLNGGGILPPSNEDPKGRMLKLGLELRWP
jgi:outer membrane receptor protein involved in Fe transport